MTEPFLVFGYQGSMGPKWLILSAWVTEALAVQEMERIKLSVMSPHYRACNGKAPSGWCFWGQRLALVGGADQIPVTWINCWAANSVGGLNPWSYLAVARLHVQGSALDQLVEAVL